MASVFPAIKKTLLLSAIKTVNIRFFCCIILAWILTGILSHLVFVNLSNTTSSSQLIRANVLDWLSAPIRSTSQAPLLKYGKKPDSKNQLRITEFADFLCPYCKNSYYTLKLLKSSRPDLYVEYYSLPLDQCQGDGVSCTLTKGVYCAEKQKQGWNMHHLIFDNQKKFISLSGGYDKTIEVLKQVSGQLPVQWLEWEDCIQSQSAMDIQKAQLQAGQQMNITSTPTILVNGKKIEKIKQQYFIKTIQAIKKHLEKNGKTL